jgi:carbon-monoxide dehydrogenase medium subunit
MYSFTFERPQTLRQAISLLSKNEDAKLLAGGHTLLPTMKLRLASPPVLVDLSRVEGLSGIEAGSRSVTIGAMTRHNEVHTSPVVQQSLPVLAKLAGLIGDPATTPQPTIRRHASGWGPPSSPTSAASPPMTSSPACFRPRWSPLKSSPK